MTQVRRIIGDVPPTRTTEAKGKPESTGPSVFAHAYEGKNGNGKISAEELNIATKLEAAQKTLSKLAKSVSRSDVASTIEKLQNMAETLKNGTVSYDRANSAKIDEITADCNQRIADAKKISKIVEQLKQNPTKGVETFERTTFSSQTALRALGDETHNINAEKLQKQDKEQKVVAEVKTQMEELLNQQIEAYMKTGKDFDKSKLRAVHAGISDIEITAEIYAEANNLKGEYRNKAGQQVIGKDATEITVTFMFHGQPYTISKVVDKIAKGVNREFTRPEDDGVTFTEEDNNTIRE